MHIRLAAEAEETLLLFRVDQQRKQRAIAEGRDAGFLTVTSIEPEPSSGNVLPANCASTSLLISVKGMSMGTPIVTLPGVGGTMVMVAGNGRRRLGLDRRDAGLRLDAEGQRQRGGVDARLGGDRAGRPHFEPQRRQRRAWPGALSGIGGRPWPLRPRIVFGARDRCASAPAPR